MPLIYGSDYLAVLEALNEARDKFSLRHHSIADIVYGNVIRAAHHNELSALIESTRNDIQNQGFRVTGTFSVPRVSVGQLIERHPLDQLNTSAHTLINTCYDYSSDHNSDYGDDGDDSRDYGDNGNDSRDYSSNCGDLTSSGYESGSADDSPDCWINT